MSSSETTFEIRFCAATGTSTVLTESGDANAATMAFHAALDQLRADDRDGDVLLVKRDFGDRVLLRHPLVCSVQHVNDGGSMG